MTAVNLTLGDDGILVAAMDLPGRPMNVVGDVLMEGINTAIDKLAEPAVKGLILTSNKADFCAGGDLDRMSKWATPQEPFDASMDDGSNYAAASRRSDDDEDSEYSQVAAAEATLQESLINQLSLMSLPERDKRLAMILIAHLDEDGYLTHNLDDLCALIAEHMEVEPDDLRIALRRVQALEPTGVAARSLSECLSLQLKALPGNTPQLHRALRVVEHHLDALAARDFVKLKRLLRCDDQEVKQVRELIVSLDPKPSRAFARAWPAESANTRKSSARPASTSPRSSRQSARLNRVVA